MHSAFGVIHKLDEREKKGAVLAATGGTAVGVVGLAPKKIEVPDAKTKVRGRKAKVKHLRRMATNEGKRFGNEGHIARIAQGIRDNGFDRKQPLEVVQYRNGKQRLVGGHHRLGAAEMLGMKKVPIKITRSSEKKPTVSSSLFFQRSKQDKIKRSRKKPYSKLTDAQIDAAAAKRPNAVLNAINEFHSRKGNLENAYNVKYRPGVERAMRNPKIVGPVAGSGALAATALAYRNKD
jgi:ParB-like nuclease domain